MLQINANDEKETDRKEESRNVYGLRSLLGSDMCQYCGSTDGMMKVWTYPEDITDDRYTLEPCPECNV